MADTSTKISEKQAVNAARQFKARQFLSASLLLSVFGSSFALETNSDAMLIQLYPRSQLVDSAEEESVSTHRIMLGALERVNHEITPEVSRYVQGKRIRKTYLLVDEQRTNLVFGFYVDQLARQGQVLYECAGRACGSSNDWANGVFERRILYGPEQYQHYSVGLVKDQYLAIYVAQRATGQVYVHVDIIKAQPGTTNQDLALDSTDLLQVLMSGISVKLDLKPSEAVTANLANALELNKRVRVYLVGHDRLRSGETIPDSLSRTAAIAEEVRRRLIELGIDASRLQAFGVGPLSPGMDTPSRLEVVLMDEGSNAE